MDFKLDIAPQTQAIIDDSLVYYKEANQYRYTNIEKYVSILNELYRKESERRYNLLTSIKGDRDNIKTTLQYISKREHIGTFVCDWCWTYDPRNATIGLPTILPMILFPNQVKFFEWLYNLYLNQRRGLIEKSRDAGATWLFVLMMTFEWRWTEGFAGGIGSNKLDNVDQRDNPDCIFEKIRTLIKLLPSFWMPEGFDIKKHDKIGNLNNPEMGSNVSGQGGKDIGRGGRRSIYLVDEAASLEFPLMADAALSNNTNCQIDLSTPKGMNHFGQKRHSGNLPVWTFHWKDDPRKDENWYADMKKTLDPVVLAQEVDINYHASVEGIFIKPEWIKSAVELDLKPIGPKGAGLDVAAGGTNKSALAFRFGPCVSVESFVVENAVDLTHMTIDMCNKAEVEYLHYDRIGVGHGVYSTIERTEKKMEFPYFGLEAGDKPSDLFYDDLERTAREAFINARAEWWYRIARRFEKTYEHVQGKRVYPDAELISIPNNGQLIAELASPKKFHTESGKIKCESKDSMLKRGIKSPDMADAVVLAFLPQSGGRKHIIGQISPDVLQFIKINWELPHYKTRHYGAIVIDKDLKTNCMSAVWDEEDGNLLIYGEFHMDHPDSDKIAEVMSKTMQLNKVSVDKMVGNKMMFTDFKMTVRKEINRSFEQYVHGQFFKIKEAKKYDPVGSVTVLNRLFRTNSVKIDKRCKHIYQQFVSWKLENQKFECSGMREAILLIISELMTYTPFQQKVMKKPEYTDHNKTQFQITTGGDPLGV